MIKLNLDAVEESKGSFDRPGAGAYVLRIISAKDVPEKEYLLLTMDIVEGKFKGYGEETEARTGQDWGYMKAYLSYKTKAQGIFKHNVKIIDADNTGKNIYARVNGGDETCLNGAFVCAVYGEQEYKKNDGTIGTRLGLPSFISGKDFRAGNYKVPEKKLLPKEEVTAPMPTYEETPF